LNLLKNKTKKIKKHLFSVKKSLSGYQCILMAVHFGVQPREGVGRQYASQEEKRPHVILKV